MRIDITEHREVLQTEFVDVAHRSKELRVQQLWGLNLARMKKKFHSRTMRVAELYVRWWNLLQEDAPSIAACRELGFSIQSGIERIRHMWRLFVSTASVPPSVLALYAKIFECLLGDHHEAAKVREKYAEYAHAGPADNVAFKGCGPDEGIVEVSAVRGHTGEVMSYNLVFSQISGYVPGELIKMDIDLMIPEIYREAHKKAFGRCRELMEYGGKCQTGRKIRAHLLDKSGFLVPVVIKVVDFPHFVNGHSFVAGVSRVMDLEDYSMVHLLLDPRMDVVATSSSTA